MCAFYRAKAQYILNDSRHASRTLRTDPTAKKTTTSTKSTPAHPSKTSTQTKEILKTTEEKDKNKNKITNPNTSSKLSTNKPKTQTLVNSTLRTSTKASQPVKKSLATTQQHVSKQRNTTTTTTTQKQPLRAKHTTDIKETIKKNTAAKTTTSKLNQKIVNTKPNAVLDTPHNVTVSSPPPVRKDKIDEFVGPKLETTKPEVKIIRKGSRTLAPEEIVVLKRESAKRRIEDQIRKESEQEQPQSISLKEPVAFEVKFEEQEIKARERSRSRVKQVTLNEKEQERQDEELNYSDDFESYESDFETGSSTQSQLTSERTTTESEDVSEKTSTESNEDCDTDDNNDDRDLLNKSIYDDTEDESELTQNPITVIHRDKERKLDSGHYEMNSRNSHAPKLAEVSAQSTQHLMDSLEAFSLATSDQLDSGISTYGLSTIIPNNTENTQVFYGGYRDFNTKPIINKRGCDLMSKIQFDTLSFILFDLKPISYDIFMQTFGKLNTNQSSTQTQDNYMNTEQQTEIYETRSMWTQHPPQYDLTMVQTLGVEATYDGVFLQNSCGEISNENQAKTQTECELECSLNALKELNNQSYKRGLQNHHKRLRKPINYEHLNSFLLKSSLVLTQILGSSDQKSYMRHTQANDSALSRVSERYFYLECNFLNTLKVSKIFSNSGNNILVTVHESLPETNVYNSDFSNLLMVWCISNCDKPLRMLTSWSQVSRVEISTDSADIIVAALRDGSVALWDLRETYSFCSKLDGYLTHFAATQSIVPSWLGVKGKSEVLMDLGACLDVRSFRSQPNSLGIQRTINKTQLVSLHDSGVITIWTLVETSENSFNLASSKHSDKLKYSSRSTQKFEYSSPWARVKLVQSSIVNLKDYLETKCLQNQSRFDKTKALFQKNIYSDEALKELHEHGMDAGQQGLRFTSIECGTETIYVCSNRNFVITCSKTLKMERFRRIVINESRYLFPTAIKILSNENFLAVGLSNGSVMILNCEPNKLMKKNSNCGPKSKTPDTPMLRDSSLDIDPITGKSCAIQNIVLNAQKSFEMDFKPQDSTEAFRPDTAAYIALIDSKQKPFELRVYDQQFILAGSVLRKNLIQSIELSSDGWRLFALTNGHIRIYDFYLDGEVTNQGEDPETGSVSDIATGKCNSHENNLVILKEKSQVEVHFLKK